MAVISRGERANTGDGEPRTTALTGRCALRPYSRYRDSGVSWISRIPAAWEVRPFKRCARIAEGQVDPADVRFNDRVLLAPNHVESGSGRILALETAADQGSISGKYVVRTGDIVYSKIRPALNKACIAAGDWLCSADMYPIRVGTGVYNRFFLYAMLSEPFVRLMVDESMRVAMPKVNRDTLSTCPMLRPPLDEQRAIAAFLDRETARIDALVVKHECLTQQMHDYRSAVATAAVLRGVAPGALARQDVTKRVICAASGWVTRRVRQVVEFIGSGKTPLGGAESYAGEGILLIRSQNVHDDGLRLDDVAYIDEATDNSMSWSRVRASDVLLNITGASIGRCSLVPEKFPRANVNQHVCIVRPRTGAVDPAFLHLALSSDFVAAQIDAIEDGVSREALTYSDVGNLWFPMPLTVAAQRELVAATCARVGSIDAVCARSRVVVDRLREYRSALITAAVTGQIDVRGEVAA